MKDISWEWVESHISDDPKTLWLKYGKDREAEIIQVECRRRFGKKLAATLLRAPRWVFPSVLAGEQSTSDRLAAFHASLVPECGLVVDLTAGLGIDALHCAGIADRVVAIEKDPHRAACLAHNAREAGAENVEVVEADCRDWLESYGGKHIDMAFIDPARRDADGGRVFALSDCEPDVIAMLPLLRAKCDRVLVKMSPMLDISSVLESLPCCVRIFALGTPTECKELLALLDFAHAPAPTDDIAIEAVTIGPDTTHTFRCTRSEELVADAVYGVPRAGDTVCEPYPAVMKAGAVRMVAQRYSLQKVAPNTHVYFESSPAAAFPGEQRRVVEVLPWASKVLKRFRSKYPRIQVAARNFGMSAEALRKKLDVADGGNLRLLAVTDISGERHLIVLE